MMWTMMPVTMLVQRMMQVTMLVQTMDDGDVYDTLKWRDEVIKMSKKNKEKKEMKW
jgi:hypothetical protein